MKDFLLVYLPAIIGAFGFGYGIACRSGIRELEVLNNQVEFLITLLRAESEKWKYKV